MPNDLDYFMSHPPRCLERFRARALAEGLSNVIFDGHGEEWNPVFAITCACGGTEFRISGYALTEPDCSLFLSPLEACCTKCGQGAPLLDTDVHGYDAELGHGSCSRRAEGTPDQFRCPGCSAERGLLFTRFEFTQDLFDGSFDDVQVEKEDLFTWVTCVSRCSSCAQDNIVADFECA